MHLKSDTALDLIENTMSGIENTSWDNHLRTCSECAVELQNWTSLVELVRRTHLLSAPEDVVASGKQIFHEKKLLEFRPSLRQITASVVFDSSAQPPIAGVRAEAATYEPVVARQLVLQAEEVDIYVRVSVFEDRFDLLGQILPRGSRSFIKHANLYLRHDDERIASASVNDYGEFQFSDVPDGTLSLQIDLPTVTIIGSLDAAI